ncbi:MAG: hypothetical protein U0165_03435 [Polyangiaceae bacterium]
MPAEPAFPGELDVVSPPQWMTDSNDNAKSESEVRDTETPDVEEALRKRHFRVYSLCLRGYLETLRSR